MGMKEREGKYHGWKTAERDNLRASILYSADHDAGWQLGIETPTAPGGLQQSHKERQGKKLSVKGVNYLIGSLFWGRTLLAGTQRRKKRMERVR